MGDLAPAPTERTFDNVARTPETSLATRRRGARKAPPAPAKEPETAPEPEPELVPELEADHQLDVLA
jgi:hypothetical protein